MTVDIWTELPWQTVQCQVRLIVKVNRYSIDVVAVGGGLSLTLLHSEKPKFYGVLAILSAKTLRKYLFFSKQILTLRSQSHVEDFLRGASVLGEINRKSQNNFPGLNWGSNECHK